jgi:hypothetical protein
MLAVTPGPPCGVPAAVSAGQVAAHPPVHLLVVPVSVANRYNVLPSGPTRICPSLASAATLTFAFVPALDALELDDEEAEEAACEALELLDEDADFELDEQPTVNSPPAMMNMNSARRIHASG